MEITDSQFDAANRRGAETRAGLPAVVKVHYDRRIARIVITLASGLELAFAAHRVQGLEGARPDHLDDAEISPSGLGIHFPKLDADLYIPALLEGFLGTKRWMASENGKLGGKSVSATKAAAARQNGKLGGRPKKNKDVTPTS
jgi:hypothetical protein